LKCLEEDLPGWIREHMNQCLKPPSFLR
jgi:hypothetical protein